MEAGHCQANQITICKSFVVALINAHLLTPNYSLRRGRQPLTLNNCSALVGCIGRGFFPLLIIPDHANHCDEHGHDRPSRDASNQNEEQELSDIIAACFSAEEFTAQFVESG